MWPFDHPAPTDRRQWPRDQHTYRGHPRLRRHGGARLRRARTRSSTWPGELGEGNAVLGVLGGPDRRAGGRPWRVHRAADVRARRRAAAGPARGARRRRHPAAAARTSGCWTGCASAPPRSSCCCRCAPARCCSARPGCWTGGRRPPTTTRSTSSRRSSPTTQVVRGQRFVRSSETDPDLGRGVGRRRPRPARRAAARRAGDAGPHRRRDGVDVASREAPRWHLSP